MASFFKNTFDNLVQNINQTFNSSPTGRTQQPPNSTRQRSSGNQYNANSRSRPKRTHPTAQQQQYQQQNRATSNNNNGNAMDGQHSPRVFVRTIPNYHDQTSQQNYNPYINNSQQQQHHQSSSQQHQQNFTSGPPPNYSQQQQQPPPPPPPQSQQQPQQQQQNHHNQPSEQTGPNPNSMANNKLDICDIHDVNDINKLSAKELKIILTRNCVDYKGVFEKEVLREKVMQLWIDCNERKERRRVESRGSREPYDSDDIDENQACKICMEREINCVLLECGHMLTCVTCGRKLAECPICRQNVTRCVRTFRG